LLSYTAVEKAPVWFFDSCKISARSFHPTCSAYFWKSATNYEYPVYSYKNIVLGSPLHLQSLRGKKTIDSITFQRTITRVFIEGEATEGIDSISITNIFKGKCKVMRLPAPVH
jgi:hypothetical protein